MKLISAYIVLQTAASVSAFAGISGGFKRVSLSVSVRVSSPLH